MVEQHVERLSYRRVRSRMESPRALWWSGLALLAMTVFQYFNGVLPMPLPVGRIAVIGALALGAWLISRPWTPAWGHAPIMTIAASLVIVEFQMEYLQRPSTAAFAHVLLVMVAVAPILLDPSAYFVVASASLIAATKIALDTTAALAPTAATDWILLAVMAEVIGGILLALRLRAIDELGDVVRQHRHDASIDPLTGLLNRHGLQLELPVLAAAANRAGKQLYTVFIDIDGLKAANDRFGHEFGDEVIKAVADGMRALAPSTAALGRWGGDEFIGLDAGEPPAASDLVEVMRRHLSTSGIDIEKWPGTVSIGVAAGTPSDPAGIAQLIAEADAHMYARRRVDRGRLAGDGA